MNNTKSIYSETFKATVVVTERSHDEFFVEFDINKFNEKPLEFENIVPLRKYFGHFVVLDGGNLVLVDGSEVSADDAQQERFDNMVLAVGHEVLEVL